MTFKPHSYKLTGHAIAHEAVDAWLVDPIGGQVVSVVLMGRQPRNTMMAYPASRQNGTKCPVTGFRKEIVFDIPDVYSK